MNDIKYTGNDDRISVYTYQTDRFKSENISIYFSVPTVRERSVARSLLLSVLKRGTQKYPSQRAINERLDELYATLVNLKNQKFDQTQLLGMSADIIYSSYTEEYEDLLPDVLEVMEQMLFHPVLDEQTRMFFEEYLQSEKENYKSIILSQINEPRTYASIRCREEMFSSLGIIDRLDTMCEKIDVVTVQDLYDCYLEILSSAKILVFYVGKRSGQEVLKQLEDALSLKGVAVDCNTGEGIRMLEATEEPNEITESSCISQGRLVMGLNCGITWRDDDYYAMLLCNEILGASPISKLMMGVREKLSLCYECSSVYNSARGALFITTGIDCENYELAKGAILNELESIKAGDITSTEFEAAKRSIFNVYSAVADSPNAIERFYLGRLVNGIDADVSDFLRRIDLLTTDDVVRAANKLSLHTVYFLHGEDGMEEDCDE